MKMYFAVTYRPKIEEVEIKHQTERQVVLMNGRREHKVQQDRAYFENWHDAHAWLVRKHSESIERAERQLAYLKSEYEKFLAANPKP